LDEIIASGMNPPPGSYSEDALVEQPSIELLEGLGWDRFDAFDEFGHPGGSPLGRETKTEVVLTARLRNALRRLKEDSPELHAALHATDQRQGGALHPDHEATLGL
jgi:hypothetical protein